jgi:hypothetical protein
MLTPSRLVAAALAAWMTCVALALAFGAPLTGDECAYGLLARGSGVDWLYRSRGMVELARVGLAFGGSDVAMRVASALASCGIIVAIAAVGRRLGPWTGALGACVIAGTHTFVMRGPELLGDLPATACLLGAIAIAIDELERAGGASYRLVAAAPLCATAFYVRYGTAPVIAIIALAAVVLWWRSIARRPAPVLVTAAVLVALLVPFAIASQRATGSILGILRMSEDAAGRSYIGQGLRSYFTRSPWHTYGVLLTPLAVVGLAGAVLRRDRIGLFLASVAVGQLVALGVVSHASTRFIFVALCLLVLLGLDTLVRARLVLRHATWARRIGVFALAAAWLGMVIAIVPIERHIARGLYDLVGSAQAIRIDAAGAPCTVVARATPQLMWYSGCSAVRLSVDPSAPIALPAGRRGYAAYTPKRPLVPVLVARLTGTTARRLWPWHAWALDAR